MPIKLVGPKVNYTGKTLWEILGNLKNFGVGRIVYKSHFLNYPEVSYYKIVKVQPVETPKDKYYNRRVMVWTEHVFRGTKYPELVKMHDRTFKPKFQLVPRSEEDKFINAQLNPRKTEVPDLQEWPPLMKILLEREAALKGSKELPLLRTKLAVGPNTVAVPSSKVPPSKLKPPRLYADLPVAELQKKLESLKLKAEAAS